MPLSLVALGTEAFPQRCAKHVIKRMKGRKLQPRWTWDALKPVLPPEDTDPPQRGMPSLETNHGFTGRFTPAGSLGPCTNHDMNSLLRLPVLPTDLKECFAEALAAGSQVTSSDFTESGHQLLTHVRFHFRSCPVC